MHDVETDRPPLPPQAKSLPARYYIDPDYYRTELEWFFFGMWIHAGRADEIPNPGDFLVRDVAGESLIVVRRDGGELSAFFNVCGHRGTRLTEEKAGRFASTIQCPYHAWTYDLKGCLLAAPKMERSTGFRLEDYPLRQAAIEIWDGNLFLNLADKPQPLMVQLSGVNERFRGWQMQDLRLKHRVVYDVAANWKLIIHNYSECLHCPGVHPALQKLTHYLSGENEPAEPGVLGGRMRLRDGIGTLSFDGQTPRLLAWFERRRMPLCLLLCVATELALEHAPRLRDDAHTLAARRRPHRNRLRMALPPRRDRRARLRPG